MNMVSRSCLAIKAPLGAGNFGTVFKATVVRHREQFNHASVVALKTFDAVEAMDYKAVMMEAALLHTACDHTHVVRLLAVVDDSVPIGLVLELADLGDLRSYLRQQAGSLSDDAKVELAVQITSGLRHVHDCDLVHRDLASRNVLLFRRTHAVPLAKLGDFGLSRYLSKDHDYYKTAQLDDMPFRWLSPEALRRGNFTFASDIWSLGVTLWEIYNEGKTPYGARTLQMIIEMLNTDARLSLSQFPESLAHLVSKMWHVDPSQRPAASRVERTLTVQMSSMPGFQHNPFTEALLASMDLEVESEL